ncbi:MAG: DUF748 domain-containing protein [Mariprofundaceae bacterium]|nr:DUF748 domain-containing protein [Mariprofundaceae bacterium]
MVHTINKHPVYLRALTWLFTSLFIAVVLLFVCMPWWLRPVLETALSNALQQTVLIQSVQLDARSGLLRVSGIRIGQLGLRQLQLHVRLPALWQHRIEIAYLRLESPSLTIIQNEKGISIAGLPPPSKKSSEKNSNQGTPWTIHLQQIDVQYARIRWQRNALGQKAELYLYWLHAEKNSDGAYNLKVLWQADAKLPKQGVNHATLKGELGGILSDPMDNAVPDFAGKINLRAIQVDGYSMRLQTSAISWDGYSKAIKQSIHVYSKVTLQKTTVQSPDQELTLNGLTWHGTLNFSPSKSVTEIQGALQVSPIKLTMDNYSQLSIQETRWKGRLKHEQNTTSITGSWHINDVYAAQKDKQLSVDSLNWHGLLQHGNDKNIAKGLGEINGVIASLDKQKIQLNSFSWDGLLQHENDKNIAKGLAKINGIVASSDQQKIRLDNFLWDGLLQQNGMRHAIKGDWQMAGMELRAPKQNIQLKQWHWQGEVRSELKEQNERIIHGSQTLSLQGLKRKATNQQQGLQWLQWDGSWQLHISNKNINFSNRKNNIRLSHLSLSQPDIGLLKIDNTRWKGGIEAIWCKFKNNKKSCKSNVKARGRLNLTALHIPLSLDSYTNIQRLQWQGLMAASDKKKIQQATLNGDLSIEHFRLQTTSGTPKLAMLQLNGLDISATQTLAQRQLSLSLQALITQEAVWTGIDKTAMFAQLQKLTLSELEIEAKQARMPKDAMPEGIIKGKSLHLSGLKAAWKRIEENSTVSTKDQVLLAKNVTPTASPTHKSSSWQWQLDQFIMDGDNKIAVLDQQITPEWQATFSEIQAKVGAINNNEPRRKTPVELSAKLSPAGAIHMKGTVVLQNKKSKKLALNGHVKVQGVDAAPFSGYVEVVSGYALRRGTVHADLEGKLVGSTLDSILHLKLQHLEVVAKQKTAIDALRGLVGLSPDAALDTLRDSNNEIALDIPIVGDLKAPDFHLQDIIQQALGGSLQKASMMYLQYAFQPYGALLEAAIWVGEQVHAIRLPSIAFPLGSSESIDKNKNDILQKAADFLNKNPKTSLALCGHANVHDAYAQTSTAQKEQKTPPKDQAWLLNLAKQRAESLIYILRNDMHVAASQLQRCRPTVTEKGKAQVALLL